jgi:ligand-binding sensor domain-containing protein/signal transduction histidine kinase
MPKHSMKLLGALAFILAGGLQLSAAQARRFVVREWTPPDEGMPQSVVFTIAQTHDGYLWLGTGNGLARFDGLRFKTFDAEQAPQLTGSKILKLFEDSRGNLWIATDNAGVVVIDPQGRGTTVRTGEAAAEGPLVAVCEDRAGGVWFTMSKGQLYRYARGSCGLVLKNCRGLMTDDFGVVWVGALEGKLLGLGPIADSPPAAVVSYEIAVRQLDFLAASKRGGYWRLAEGRIGKWNGDRLLKDLGAYPWSAGVPILAACEDLDGNLVVGTYGEGVYWFDGEGNATRVEGITHGSIWCLVVDREGSLWVGTNGGGLARVKPQKFKVLEGTLGATVQSVSPDHQGGVWIGSNGDWVDHWAGEALLRFTNIWPPELPSPPGQAPIFVQSVLEDARGKVWAGGASILDPLTCFFSLQNGRFLPVLGPPALKQDPAVLHEDRQGVLWIGTRGGLVRSENGSWKVYTTRDGLSSDRVRAIASNREGGIWVGTDRGGLNLLQNGKFTVYSKQAREGLPADDVTSLYLDDQEVLWIGTAGGLVRHERGQWRRFTTREGLASNKIGYLVEDGEGFLWIGSNAGLMRIPKRRLNEVAERGGSWVPCRLFGKADGLPTGECSADSQPGACRTADGRLWLPTIKGLVVVQPSLLKPNTNPPPVVIEAVRVDGELEGEDRLRAPAPNQVTLSASKESLEIHFASLNLAAPDSGLFRYRLSPHEREWTQAEAQRRYARYTRLPHGHYRFEVTACNEDGLWNEVPAVLAVVVLPPFWLTWWFMGASTVLLLTVIVGSVHYVSTQRLHRQLVVLRQQEALERERARIARDLHDQLGANLTQVALLGEMAESDRQLPDEVAAHARQICQTARETTHALDEIVWTVNPSNDTLEGLVNYICKYAQDYLALAGLKYRLEIPAQLPAVSITPELRHNVFLAAKEAINNVVKHAHATSAWLRLLLEPGRFILEIEDNGKGLKPADEKKGRNGLRNMRKRMEETGGSFEVGAGAGQGTRLRLIAPLGPAGSGVVDALAAGDHTTQVQ